MVHVVKAPIVEVAVGFGAIGIADRTTMPKTALELVDSVGFLMVSVYRVPRMGIRYSPELPTCRM